MAHKQMKSLTTELITWKKYNILLAELLFISLLCLSVPLNAATYKLTYTGLWDGSHVQSNSLPNTAHLTTLIGATHQPGQPLWEPGVLASVGIEDVAEQGITSTLMNEIDFAIRAGTALNQVTLDGHNSFPTSTVTTFDIFDSHSSISLISMVAPSPDWFVGISNVSLKQGDTWLNTLSLDLSPWDAGTEEGNGFSLTNQATVPQQPISLINGTPFNGTPVIANITFDLVPTPVPLPGASILMITGLFSLFGHNFIRNRPKRLVV